MGSNPFNRFVHDSNTSHMIVNTIDKHFVAIFQYIESNEVANEKSTKVKAELVLGRVQMIPGVNSLKAMQFMHSCCLAGLLPYSCMQDFTLIELSSLYLKYDFPMFKFLIRSLNNILKCKGRISNQVIS